FLERGGGRDVGEFVETLLRPEEAGGPERDARVRRSRRIRQEIDAEEIAEALIIGASGQLNRTASLESLAVADAGVAEGLRQLCDRLVSALSVGRSPDLFHEAELAGLVRQLRQDGGCAR